MKDLEDAIKELLTKIKTKKQLKLDIKENWVKVEYNSYTENKYTTNVTKNIKQAKGIYIVCFKNKNLFKILKGIEAGRKDLAEEINYQPCFYVGKTCNSFASRVLNNGGHIQGGNTSFCIKIFNLLKENDNKRIKNNKYDYKNKNEKEEIAKWIKENLQFYLYPIAMENDKNLNSMAIGVTELALIKKLKPVLNSLDIDNDTECEC